MMRYTLCYLIILGFVLLGSVGCAQRPETISEPGDTLFITLGKKILIPRGKNPDQVPIFADGLDNRWPSNSPLERWVSIKTIRLFGDYKDGKQMAHDYWKGSKRAMELASVPTSTRIFEVGHGDYSDYALIGQHWSVEDPEPYLFKAECMMPLVSQVLTVTYIIHADAYDESGGVEELRRFAKRVRLVDE